MSSKRQQDLFDQKPKRGRKPIKPYGCFGGMYLKNYHANTVRPMNSKKALHLTLRSSKATGSRSFKNKKYEAAIWRIISEHAKKTGIQIYSFANAGNHIHLLIRAKHRDDYNSFIRTITGLIARLVGQSEKGQPLKQKFWDGRPFTRIVSFARHEFQTTKSYLLRYTLEAIGWMPYISRDHRLPAKLRQWWLTPVQI